jgi:hypothetical protein
MEVQVKDEDQAFEQWRQAKIDALTEEEFRHLGISQTVIGSALKDSEKVQKFATRDPWPEIKFSDTDPNNLSPFEWAAYLAIVFAMIMALVLWEVVK